MQFVRGLVAVVLAVAAVAAALPYIFEPVNGASIPEGHQSAAALTIFFAVLGLGAGLLFALSLNGFTTSFKKAYFYICLGLILHGLSVMVFPVLLLYTPLFWTDLPNLLGDAPYFVGTVMIFIGLLRFAKLLSLQTWLQKIYLTIPLAVGFMFLGWLVPHGSYLFSELRFDLVKSVLWLEPIFTLYCLPLLLHVRRNASQMYARPLLWLIVATVCNFIAGAVYAISNYIQLPLEQSAIFYDIVGALYALTQLIFLIAGYSFSRITRNRVMVKQEGTIIDVITYVASLVSQPKAINSILERLRVITAAYNSDKDLHDLVAIYQNIENYLVNQETLRTFTKDGLRRDIENRFSPEAYNRLFR